MSRRDIYASVVLRGLRPEIEDIFLPISQVYQESRREEAEGRDKERRNKVNPSGLIP